MKKLVLLGFLFGNLTTIGQSLKSAEVKEDLTFLVEKIKTYDPALQEYHPNFEEEANKVLAEISDDSLAPLDFYTVVTKICALAHEGHFKVGDWADDIHAGFGSNTYTYLPVEVKILSGKIFVANDYSNEQRLNKGDEIIAINGVNTESILNKLLQVTPSDGEITTYAYRKIEEGFPWLFYFYIDQPDTFEFRIVDQNQQERTESISALIRSDQVENVKKYISTNSSPNESTDEGFYTLDITNEYALLTLPSFDFRRVNKYEVKSKTLYKSIFKELQDKQVQHLVIDLRYNTGGRNEFADDMVPFISRNASKDPYLKKTISWEGKERKYSLSAPSKLAFKGSIYVLVNGKTYSAGGSLARYLKEYGDATVIGTETGTRYEGFAAGSSQVINLPNSQLKIEIPRYHILFPPSSKQTTKNRGLLPDYEITQTFESYSEEKDLNLEKVLMLIEESN